MSEQFCVRCLRQRTFAPPGFDDIVPCKTGGYCSWRNGSPFTSPPVPTVLPVLPALCAAPQPPGWTCQLAFQHRGACAPQPVVSYGAEKVLLGPSALTVWVLVTKSLKDGNESLYNGILFASHQDGIDYLDNLPYRTAKTLRLMQLVPLEPAL
jgi:hypothetical protein